MRNLRTHYDNLKVANDAPTEVIRAAYRSLSQKYHPDRNGGNLDSEKIMRVLNEAYDVLSDPVKRKEHDEWIKRNINSSTGNKEKNKTDEIFSTKDFPLNWQQYSRKYRVEIEYIRRVVKAGKVRGAIYRDTLYLEDKPPYDTLEGIARGVIPSPLRWSIWAALIIGLYLFIYLNENPSKPAEAKVSNLPPLPPGFVLEEPRKPQYATTARQQPLPTNGGTKYLSNLERVAPLEIKTTAGSHYLVKIKKPESNTDIQSIFVHGGKTVTTEVPLGRYQIVYASGEKWYGYEKLFGAKTRYSKANKLFTFKMSGNQITGFTITLFQVSNGNLRTSRIDSADF